MNPDLPPHPSSPIAFIFRTTNLLGGSSRVLCAHSPHRKAGGERLSLGEGGKIQPDPRAVRFAQFTWSHRRSHTAGFPAVRFGAEDPKEGLRLSYTCLSPGKDGSLITLLQCSR